MDFILESHIVSKVTLRGSSLVSIYAYYLIVFLVAFVDADYLLYDKVLCTVNIICVLQKCGNVSFHLRKRRKTVWKVCYIQYAPERALHRCI